MEFYKRVKGLYNKDETENSSFGFMITCGLYRLANRLKWIDSQNTWANCLDKIKNIIPVNYHDKVYTLNEFANYYCISKYPTCKRCPVNKTCEAYKNSNSINNTGEYKFYKVIGTLPFNPTPKFHESQDSKDSDQISK